MPESSGELDLLRAYLRDRDVTCPVCGHNLRGAAGFACPECGGRLDLHVVSMDMPHRWWIACVLAFALPLGLFGSIAAAGVWSLAHGWMNTHDKVLLGGCWALTLLCAVNLTLLGRRRTTFIQRSRWSQRMQSISWIVIMSGLSLGLMYMMTRAPYDWPWSLIDGEPMP